MSCQRIDSLCSCLGEYCSVPLLSYSISPSALGSPDLILSYSMIALALHNIIILIITHLYILTPKSTYQHRYLALSTAADFEDGLRFNFRLFNELTHSNGLLGGRNEVGVLVQQGAFLPHEAEMLSEIWVEPDTALHIIGTYIGEVLDLQVILCPSRRLSRSRRLKGLFLYTVGVLCNVECCIRLTALVFFCHTHMTIILISTPYKHINIHIYLHLQVKHEAVDFLREKALKTMSCLHITAAGEGKPQIIRVEPPLLTVGGRLPIGKSRSSRSSRSKIEVSFSLYWWCLVSCGVVY